MEQVMVTVKLKVTEVTRTEDVLTEVNAALRQRAYALEVTGDPELQYLAENLWRIRADLIRILVDDTKVEV